MHGLYEIHGVEVRTQRRAEPHSGDQANLRFELLDDLGPRLGVAIAGALEQASKRIGVHFHEDDSSGRLAITITYASITIQ